MNWIRIGARRQKKEVMRVIHAQGLLLDLEPGYTGIIQNLLGVCKNFSGGGGKMPQPGPEKQKAQVPAAEKPPRKVKKDHHFPNIGFENPIRRLYESNQRFNDYALPGQVVADLGCGPGYFTFPLAERVGPEGKVYATDSNPKAIQAVEKKITKRGLRNIDLFTGSATDLGFIPDGSVDFVLANGLLCCVAPDDRDSVVKEIKRILKPDGEAYLIAGRGYPSYMTDEAWEQILAGFSVKERNIAPYKGGDYWARVSLSPIEHL